jgi:hypothetical protein
MATTPSRTMKAVQCRGILRRAAFGTREDRALDSGFARLEMSANHRENPHRHRAAERDWTAGNRRDGIRLNELPVE